MKPAIFVIIQFAALGAILLTGPLFAPGAVLLAIELAGLALGAWAVLSMGISRVSIFPTPRAGAQLVARGPYAFIRHPMYSALLLFTLPIVIAAPTPLRMGLWLTLLVNLVFKLHYEESLLVSQFPGYSEYQQRTSKLIPFLY
jgi:protein-S-isoprenylcysteine O-methyltransferase Ste14